ncbi:MAG: CHAT domain-containing tetratricopeptide repeat protein [Bacteroidota bacterium]
MQHHESLHMNIRVLVFLFAWGLTSVLGTDLPEGMIPGKLPMPGESSLVLDGSEKEMLSQWLDRVESLIDSAQYEEALKLNQRIFEKIQDQEEYLFFLIKGYNFMSSIYGRQGQLRESLEMAQQALTLNANPLNRADSLQKAASQFKIAIISRRYSDFEQAQEYATSALEIRSQILSDQDPILIENLHFLGLAYYESGRYSQAIDYHKLAIERIRKGGETERMPLANILSNLGNVYAEIGDYETALDQYVQALHLDSIHLGKDHPNIATTYSNIGIVYKNMYEFEKALEYFHRALPIRINAYGEEHAEVGFLYLNIGVALTSKGDLNGGLIYYLQALNMLSGLLEEHDRRLGMLHANIGTIYQDLDSTNRAISHYNQAISILKLSLGPDHPKLANVYNSMATLYADLRDHDQALSYYFLALDIYQSGKTDSRQSTVYLNIGLAYEEERDYSSALTYYKLALELNQTTFGASHRNVADAYYNLGELLVKMGKHKEAWLHHQQALKILKFDPADDNPFSRVSDLQLLKRVFLGLENYYQSKHQQSGQAGYLDSLHHHYQLMIELEEYIQEEFNISSTRAYHASRALPVFEAAITNLMEMKEATSLAETFRLAEKTKSRQLLEQLQQSGMEGNFGLPASLIEQERELNKQIGNFETLIFEAENERTTNTDSAQSTFRNQLFALRHDRLQLRERFRIEYPAYYQLRYSRHVIDIETVQEELLPSSNDALLEYFVGDKHLYVFIILHDTFFVREIQLDFPLEEWVQHIRCGLFAQQTLAPTCVPSDSLSPLDRYATYAYQLYQKMFAPIRPLIADQSRILLIPDGVLGYLPFEALLTAPPTDTDKFADLPYMIRDYSINYAYSATLQLEMKQKKHTSLPAHRLLACAPGFDAFRLADSVNVQSRLSPLKYNISEAEQIAALMEGDVLLRDAASKAAFVHRANDYQILHLSTHGKANDKAGDYAFLAFHSSLENNFEDAFLYNQELYHLQLNADLVVLSACETGIGELKRGEGIISLARGFSYAGAKSIVTSLWNVNDRSTKVLMEAFYTNLEFGLSKSEALRQAKLSYIQTSPDYHQSPFFWAAFISIGDAVPIVFLEEEEDNGKGWMLALLFLALFGGIGWWLFLRSQMTKAKQAET